MDQYGERCVLELLDSLPKTDVWSTGFLRGGLGSRGVLFGLLSFFAGLSHPWLAKIIVRSPRSSSDELAYEERIAGIVRVGCDAVSGFRVAPLAFPTARSQSFVSRSVWSSVPLTDRPRPQTSLGAERHLAERTLSSITATLPLRLSCSRRLLENSVRISSAVGSFKDQAHHADPFEVEQGGGLSCRERATCVWLANGEQLLLERWDSES